MQADWRQWMHARLHCLIRSVTRVPWWKAFAVTGMYIPDHRAIEGCPLPFSLCLGENAALWLSRISGKNGYSLANRSHMRLTRALFRRTCSPLLSSPFTQITIAGWGEKKKKSETLMECDDELDRSPCNDTTGYICVGWQICSQQKEQESRDKKATKFFLPLVFLFFPSYFRARKWVPRFTNCRIHLKK